MAKQCELLLAAHSEAGRWRRDAVLDHARHADWCTARAVERPDSLAGHPDSMLVVFDARMRTAELMLSAICKGMPVSSVGSGHHARPTSLRRMVEASAALHFPFSRRAARNLAKSGVARRNIAISEDPLQDYLAATGIMTEEPGDVVVALDESQLLEREARTLWSALCGLYRRGAVERVYWLGSGPARRPDGEGIILVPQGNEPSFRDMVSRIDAGRLLISDIDWVLDLAPVMNWPTLLVRPAADRPELTTRGQARLCPFDRERLPVDILAMLMRRPMERPDRVFGHRSDASRGILSRLESFVWAREVGQSIRGRQDRAPAFPQAAMRGVS